jgi:hypothetical protein
MDDGEVRPLDPKRLALFLIEGSTAIVLERLSEDAPPPESEDVELIVSTFLGGVAIPKSKRSSH